MAASVSEFIGKENDDDYCTTTTRTISILRAVCGETRELWNHRAVVDICLLLHPSCRNTRFFKPLIDII